MPIDTAALRQELATDPLGLGYAALTDVPAADALNAPHYSLPATTLPQVSFLHQLADMLVAVSQIPTGDSRYPAAQGILADWNILQPIVTTLPSINPQQQSFTGIFTALAGMGVITQAQLTSLTTVPASRAEVLFGSGTLITHLDVAQARQPNG
ncbi:MAG: hypothetical protein JO250_09135 [Armatimonadetes bacterium]|nr:hypothetical protein [Armatimonadota bacterium]